MHVAVVVLEVLDAALRDTAINVEDGHALGVKARRTARHHPHATVERYGGKVRRDDGESTAQAGERCANPLGMGNRTGDMQRHGPGGTKARRAGAIELRRIERLGRTARIRQIEHDEIVVIGIIAHEGEAVLDFQREPGVVERSPMNALQVLARDINDSKVDLAKRD